MKKYRQNMSVEDKQKMKECMKEYRKSYSNNVFKK